MRKTIFICLFILVVILSSCTRKNDEGKENYNEGKIYFSSDIYSNLDVDLFDSVDRSYDYASNDEIPNKTQNVFNVTNIFEDFKDKKLYESQIYELGIYTSSCKTNRKKDENNFYFISEYIYYKSSITSMKSAFHSLDVSNPTRYYSAEFIEDIEKLENGAIEKNDITRVLQLLCYEALSLY